ncbi:hypothetical protein C5P27_14510 [Escherichia coli]|nr:hypothetical protein C5P27_14510 [Escherichia coli]
MSCLPAKKRLTFELFGFERKPQVDRNIAWGFCPSGTSRMLNARQPQAPNAILYLLIFPAMFTFKCRNAARKINILRHSRRFFKCAYKALLPAAP